MGSLEALQQDVLDEFDRRFTDEVFQPAMTLPRGLPRLNSMVENWIGHTCSARARSSCLYIAGSFGFDDVVSPLRDCLRQGVIWFHATLRRTIMQAIEEGHLRTDTDPEQLIFEIWRIK